MRKTKYSKIEISYRDKTEGQLKENSTLFPKTLTNIKKDKGKPAVSFTKFVSDINFRNKKIFRKF